MKLSKFKSILPELTELHFRLSEGTEIPSHFHITEAGLVTKDFIDCGGTVRTEKSISFQIWVAGDMNHRLSPSKLMKIIKASDQIIGEEDLDIHIEYQSDTIGLYGMDFDGKYFTLVPKYTNCLAQDHCGIPVQKPKVDLAKITEPMSACCTPGSGCC